VTERLLDYEEYREYKREMAIRGVPINFPELEATGETHFITHLPGEEVETIYHFKKLNNENEI